VLRRDLLTLNRACGGGSGPGGTAGVGVGGADFNLGVVRLHPATRILGNDADLFEDCYGC